MNSKTDDNLGQLILILLFCLLGLTFFSKSWAEWQAHGFLIDSDFVPHWIAGVLAHLGQARDTYQPEAMHLAYNTHFNNAYQATPIQWGNLYPPTMFFLTTLLAFLPFAQAAAVFIGVGFMLYLLMVWGWARGLGVAVAFGASATWICISVGQNGLLLAALLGSGLLLLETMPLVAGLLIGLSCIKPQLGLCLPLLLLAGRHYRCFLAATLTVLAMIGLTLVVWGEDVWPAFFQSLPVTRSVIEASNLWPRFVSVFGTLALMGVPINLAYGGQALSAVTAIGLALHIWRMPTSSMEARAASAILVPFLSLPLIYDYDLPLVLIAMLALGRILQTAREKIPFLLVCAVICFLPAMTYPDRARDLPVQLMPVALWLLQLMAWRRTQA